jgi:IS30 family transposase
VSHALPGRVLRSNVPRGETIYLSLFIQARGVLKKELLAHLRATRAIRRSRHASLKRDGMGQIKDAISIRERPVAVEDRAIPGHWEGDLIAGSKNSFIATLVERRTRYVMLAKVSGKETQAVVAALAGQVQHLPRELRRTLTWDRGKELADHMSLTLATDLDIYFCDPHSPLSADCFAIACRAMRGNVAPMRTPTGFCVSTTPREPTSQPTARPNSISSHANSTSGPERH